MASEPWLPDTQAVGEQVNRIFHDHARKTFRKIDWPEGWRNLPELPIKDEIMPKGQNTMSGEFEDWNDYQREARYNESLPHNIVDGPWPSKEEYISAHYRILREDAVAPLRYSVLEFSKDISMVDSDSTYVYTDVHIQGVKCARTGPAWRANFSYQRAGKQVNWEQSKRLLTGNIVALSPQNDNFSTQCHIAVIADRPFLGGLDQNPPTIDLFWADQTDIPIDPAIAFVMVEARSGYFEAYKDMLVAMQKLRTEAFPLAKHIVSLDKDVKAPNYVEEDPIITLSSLQGNAVARNFLGSEARPLDPVDVLRHFPQELNAEMDKSQLRAFQNLLTKSVAIVQGPPGTGKTFVSVKALRVMLDNLQPGDPPIVVSAQTNHALDQLLKHVQGFCKDICRIGGRYSPDESEVQECTLYQLSLAVKNDPRFNKTMGMSIRELEKCSARLTDTINFFLTDRILTSEELCELKIITRAQQLSLSENSWVKGDKQSSDLKRWLNDQLMPIERAPDVDKGLPMEECDIDSRELKEMEASMNDGDIEATTKNLTGKGETLRGRYIPFLRNTCGKHSGPIKEKALRYLLKWQSNLYEIPEADRGVLYRYFELRVQKEMRKQLRVVLKEYQDAVEVYNMNRGQRNFRLLKHLNIKLVGCTTTGLSKYRALLSALKPRTLLVEEAAETLEGKLIGGMFESLEQLILIGDHQQLQATCTMQSLEHEPYHMRMSMFERLVNNGIGYVMLNKQRRMVPEIRKLLCIKENPFYKDLEDHESVQDREVNRPPIPGMGGVNVYFFSHTWPEARNGDLSCYNLDEAQMIAGFFNYLVLNGVEQDKITVLTYYTGQRRILVTELRKQDAFKSGAKKFNVRTVDSFQGEENDVIILSLVRSNANRTIGFLENPHRLVVALSRAKRGLYIFGNAVTLCHGEASDEMLGRKPLWDPLLSHMMQHGQFYFDGGLPITCVNHNNTTEIFEPAQWDTRPGGCDQMCSDNATLACGHPCTLRCHPFEHYRVLCKSACTRILTCGHGCSKFCHQDCFCEECQLPDQLLSPVLKYLDDWSDSEATAGEQSPDSQPGLQRGTDVQQSRSQSRGVQSEFCETSDRTSDSFPERFNRLAEQQKSIQFNSKYDRSSPLEAFAGRANKEAYTTSRHVRSTSESSESSSGSVIVGRARTSRGMVGMSDGRPKANVWDGWDAKRADADLAEKRRQEEEKMPKSTQVISEVFRPVQVVDGLRVGGRRGDVRHRQLQRGQDESDRPSPGKLFVRKAKVVTPKTSDLLALGSIISPKKFTGRMEIKPPIQGSAFAMGGPKLEESDMLIDLMSDEDGMADDMAVQETPVFDGRRSAAMDLIDLEVGNAIQDTTFTWARAPGGRGSLGNENLARGGNSIRGRNSIGRITTARGLGCAGVTLEGQPTPKAGGVSSGEEYRADDEIEFDEIDDMATIKHKQRSSRPTYGGGLGSKSRNLNELHIPRIRARIVPPEFDADGFPAAITPANDRIQNMGRQSALIATEHAESRSGSTIEQSAGGSAVTGTSPSKSSMLNQFENLIDI